MSASTFSSSVDQVGQHPLGLAEGLAARRQGRAGDGQPAQRADVVGQRHVGGPPAILHLGDPCRIDAEQQEVLAGGDADLGDRAVGCQLAQRRAEGDAVTVDDLPDGTGSPMTPSHVLWYSSGTQSAWSASGAMANPTRRPTSVRTQSMPRSSTRYFRRARCGRRRLPKSRCIVTTASTTSTTSLGRDPPERLGQQRVGVLLAGVAHAQTAADVDVVARDRSRATAGQRRHQADVVGEHVDVVVARPGHGDLELAGQVGVAVDRLGRTLAPLGASERQWRRLGGHGLVAVDPQLPVRRRLGAEPGDEGVDERLDDGLAVVRPGRPP